jgi:hypothetical protein
MLLVNGLAKVTNHPLPQSASPDVFVGIGGNDDRRNRIPRAREVFVEFKSGHRVTSATRQAVSTRQADARKSAADGKAATL